MGTDHAQDDSTTLGPLSVPLGAEVAPTAEFLRDRDLVLAADCTAFASPDLHRRMMQDRALLIGCPKLDDANFYANKLAAILVQSNVRSVRVLHMEVPCCTGILRMVLEARQLAGSTLPIDDVSIGIHGQLVDRRQILAESMVPAGDEQTCHQVGGVE